MSSYRIILNMYENKFQGNKDMNLPALKKPKNLGELLDLAGNVLAWSVIIVFFVGLPFYFKDGYSQLASNKYLFFMGAAKYTAIVMGVFFLLRVCLWGFTMPEIKAYKNIMWMDIFVVAFAVVSLISHLFSPFKTNTFGTNQLNDWFYEGSLWGTKGWFMGLMTFLCFVMLYFVLSRCLIYHVSVFIPIMVALVIICQWGVLNRYGIAPIDMKYEYGDKNSVFMASIGNINWFCGFTSVIVPLIWGLYLGVKKLWEKIVLMAAATVTFTMIMLNSSDSGYVALAVSMGVLLGFAMTDAKLFRGFLEIAISLLTVCSVIPLTDHIGHRNITSGHAEPLLGLPSCVLLLIVIAVYVIVTLKKDKYPTEKMKIVRAVYAIAVGAIFVAFVLLIVINTLTGRALPIIGDSEVFFFNSEWASKRGETWSLGVKTFFHLPFGHKLVGSGPDTFFYEMISFEDLSAEWNDYYGNARLTNAHNEIITLLVNIGLLGTAAFIGIMVTSVKASFKAAKENPEYICFALAVISYLANNVFSFQQITNTPFIFLVLGIEGAALVRIDKQEARLTKKEGKNTMQKGKKSRK